MPFKIAGRRVAAVARAGGLEIGLALLGVAGQHILERVGRAMARGVGLHVQPGDRCRAICASVRFGLGIPCSGRPLRSTGAIRMPFLVVQHQDERIRSGAPTPRVPSLHGIPRNWSDRVCRRAPPPRDLPSNRRWPRPHLGLAPFRPGPGRAPEPSGSPQPPVEAGAATRPLLESACVPSANTSLPRTVMSLAAPATRMTTCPLLWPASA